MIQTTPYSDSSLKQRLLGLSEADEDYWSFQNNARREHSHGLFQYPAMMVPQVVQSVLEQVCTVHPEIQSVGDPFAGSGTILTESMFRGFNFRGTDINPLAVLLCKVKAGPFKVDDLSERAKKIEARIKEDRGTAIEVSFTNRDKWFNKGAQIGLSRIRRAVQCEDDIWVRRFLWVALAETIRRTSNSRTSTFKLHIRPQDKRTSQCSHVLSTFSKVLERNVGHIQGQVKQLTLRGHLNAGDYRRQVDIQFGDTRKVIRHAQDDIIITSPPYGDNTTTVPYGQHAYLPLQWLPFEDIDESLDNDLLCSTHEIDRRSLGGSRKVVDDDICSLADRSNMFKTFVDSLKFLPSDRTHRVTAFFRDLDNCLEPILAGLNSGGLMVWIIGNRTVGGKSVPLNGILSELFSARKVDMVCELRRRIPSKRMAVKNNIADTMSTETILVMRKVA